MTHSRQHSRARLWLSAPMAIALIVASMLIPATSVAAREPTDMVLEWNINAVNAIGNPPATTPPTATPPGLGQPPPLAPIHLAMVHGAIYDAVMAIVDTHEPYLKGLNARRSASQPAAVAAAAHGVLVGLAAASPEVKASVDSLYAASLSKIRNGTAKQRGITVGKAAAAAMLANRVGDGRFGTLAFAVGTEPGQWRPVPLANANSFGWISLVKPFMLRRADQYRVGAPYALTSAAYAREFNEVKRLGGTTSTRTPGQAKIASWASVNPFSMVNRGLRDIALKRHLSTSQQARLFVMTSMSTADTLISCWANKHRWNFWRPQTAIQLAGTDGNPATVADPTWTSLIGNPGYPDPPSGFNCLVSGAMNAARAYFGTDRMRFSLTSVGAAPVTRNYTRFSGPIKDAIEGRILVGIHFRRADVQGAWLGQKVARWSSSHYFERED
jgi:hypothetical protein